MHSLRIERLSRGAFKSLAAFLWASALAIGWGGPAQAWEMRVCADPEFFPFTHSSETGFENRVAEILAAELNATLTYVWFPLGNEMFRDYLRAGECDLVMGVPDGHEPLISTIAYYRSPFVFVSLADREYGIGYFDDPQLRELRIGVQYTGGPVHFALLDYGLAANIDRVYDTLSTYRIEDFVTHLVSGEIDIALVWGPYAGTAAARQDVDFTVAPVTPEFSFRYFDPMFINMVIGVRRGDESLRDLLNEAITRRWDDLQEVFEEYRIPLLPLARPMLSLGAL